MLYPIGLFALAGLIIPVIIHLWHIKKGKTLKIGSILLLGESARSSATSWHIKHWPLFILRCLLLVLMVFLLTKPQRDATNTAGKKGGWILLKKEQLRQIYNRHHHLIDSLRAQGLELHAFNPGFESLSLKDTVTVYENAKTPISYAALLNQLNSQIPVGFKVELFADRRLLHFEDNLPTVAFDLKWHDTDEMDTIGRWQTLLMGKTYLATSSPDLTYYTSLNPAIPIPALTLLIYPADGEDARYVKAAINAIAHYTKRPINIKPWTAQEPAGNAAAGFWLSTHPIDEIFLAKLKNGANLLTYENGKIKGFNSTVDLNTEGAQNSARIALYQRVMVSAFSGEKVWADGFGNPVLSKEKTHHFNHYRFYSRFNPQWTDLVWDSRFIKAMLPLVLGNEKEKVDFGFEDHPADRRQLAKKQQEFIPIKTAITSVKTNTMKPLKDIFWVAALFVLIIERFLSFRLTKSRNGFKS
ncbi:MAG: BatA domain-containing protein [Bacteroidota bacterium]